MNEEMLFVDKVSDKALTKYLKDRGWISTQQKVFSREKAGDGNMNLCCRLFLNGNESIILKQSRPWVEKYPNVPAPVGRILEEVQFYKRLESVPNLTQFFPRVLGVDKMDRIAIFEDLGLGSDFSSLYQGSTLPESDLKKLISFLGELHTHSSEGLKQANLAMRELNHAHIFDLPLKSDFEASLDAITPGLNNAARILRQDDAFKKRVQELGKIYFEPGESILHGDFYPGSWLSVGGRIYVIDPEFCFDGRAEFDWGVFYAHLILSQQKSSYLNVVETQYSSPSGFDFNLAKAFAGVEIMRRLIGLAQLPLDSTYDLVKKTEMLQKARDLVLMRMPADATKRGYTEK